jgi:Lon protease-like protein
LSLPSTFPIFPLPSVLLVPGAFLPLHVFEPRYRQMVADSMAGARALAMAMPLPLREGDEPDRPRIHPVVGLGRILHQRPYPDGRSDIVVAGIARMRVEREPPAEKLYRVVVARELPDVYPDDRDLLEDARALLARLDAVADEDRERLLDLPAGRLADAVLVRLPIPTREKHRVHAIPEVATRIAEVGRALARLEGVVYPRDVGPGDPRLN